MRLPHLLAACVALCCLASAPAAEPEKDVKALREQVVKADTPDDKAKAYKALFEKVGKAGLSELMKNEDTGIALQAAWEVHKKVVKRPKEERGRVDDIYDPDELKKFVEVVKKRTKAPVPDWWAKNILDVDAFVGEHHAFISEKDAGQKTVKSKAGASVPNAAELEELKEALVYTVGKRSVEFPKDTFGKLADCYAGVIGEKRSAVAAYSDSSGFAFEIAGFEGKGGKPTWKSDVWASGRTILAGAGHHWVEVIEKDGTVCVFGAESHGMYAEAFDLATGKSTFRFCTGYWFNFSEAWHIK
jgi:hypothetical protein